MLKGWQICSVLSANRNELQTIARKLPDFVLEFDCPFSGKSLETFWESH